MTSWAQPGSVSDRGWWRAGQWFGPQSTPTNMHYPAAPCPSPPALALCLPLATRAVTSLARAFLGPLLSLHWELPGLPDPDLQDPAWVGASQSRGTTSISALESWPRGQVGPRLRSPQEDPGASSGEAAGPLPTPLGLRQCQLQGRRHKREPRLLEPPLPWGWDHRIHIW